MHVLEEANHLFILCKEVPYQSHLYDYTQYAYGRNKVNVDYDAISKVFELINKDFANHINIGIPMIGAGLAGGDWNIISDIINEKTPDLNITLYIL